MQCAVDFIETIIIGKSPILEDPFFDFQSYKRIKKSVDFDEILRYIEGKYEVMNLLKSNELKLGE